MKTLRPWIPVRRVLMAALVGGLASVALAGGPLYTFDYANRVPYAWRMDSWPNGQVPVYTDLGPLGILFNSQVNDLVSNSASQWSSVPTSSFRAAVAGDFSALGLGDVEGAGISSIIGTYNGGGIDVVYDNDGSILANFFGVPPTSVLGITDIEYVAVGSPEIVEAWMVLSGPGVRAEDEFGVGFAGVVTHEMGHALNLAHSQANGGVVNFGDVPQPEGCSAPWTGVPDVTQVETMSPFITPTPTGSGAYMASVDRLDDMAALSDLYPVAGWPGSKGTISGQVYDPAGNPAMGVNVIARNLADPFNDFTSYITGQVTKGNAGPDGSFVLDGLTPGASYVLYVDLLMAGAFSVPTPLVLPGPEEYYNGPQESGNGATDDRCAWLPVAVTAGSTASVNVRFNHIDGAPELIIPPNLHVQSVPTGITPDGRYVVGGEGVDDVPIFRWDLDANTFDTIGGSLVGSASISDDGAKVAANIVDTDGINKAAVYSGGAWTALPPVPGAVACSNSSSGPLYTSAYDISGDGSTVVGLSYGSGGCATSTIRGFKWTAVGGTVALPKVDSTSRAGRANAVNYDGSVIVGWDDRTDGLRRGEQWKNGIASLIKTSINQPAGEALAVSGDGQHIVGSSDSFTSNNAWLWSSSGGVQNLGTLTNQTNAIASALDDDAGVILGRSTDRVAGINTPTIWTSGLHWTDLNQFLAAQGVNTSGISIALGTAVSADGRTIAGYGASRIGYTGWVLKIPTAVVCHGSPTALQTLAVSFPQDLNTHLGHGDTLGPCPCVDADGDGYTTCAGDCNDADPSIHPGASDANCNGVDDNCDGAVDEGYVSQPTTCGVGACTRSGSTSCVAGAVQNACVPGTPSPELCNANGIDDDCDGIVDDVVPPAGRPGLSVSMAAGSAQLSWSPVAAATGYDVFAGDMQELRTRGGNYAAFALAGCLANDVATTSTSGGADVPAPGGGRWFLVRPVNCAGAGSYEEAGPGPSAPRDAAIATSPAACP